MANKKENYENQAELTFRLSMKALGVILTNEQAKIAYRVAILSKEKEGDISFKELALIVSSINKEKQE